MRIIKMAFIIVILIGISLIIIDFFYEGNDDWQLDSWIEFKKQIVKEHNFIQEIKIYGTSPTLIISFIIDEKLELEEIESIFKKTKSFLFSEKVFPKLREYHHKLYGGTTVKVYITFQCIKENDTYYYEFYSHRKNEEIPRYDSFQTWYIQYDNVRKEYNPVAK